MQGPLPANPRVIALILASAIFMEQVDSTVLATALPTMARSFGVPPLHLSVAITSYLLSLAVFIPVSGRVADRLGSRTVFRLAITLFTLGSFMCSLSDSVWFLVLSRILQGMGGGMMVPVARLVLIRSVPKSEFVAIMSWVLVPAMLGPVVGPPLGGFLVTYLSWRWIFYVNVPLGLAGIVATSRFIPQIREAIKAPFDVKGSFLSGASLSCLLFGLETATRSGFSPFWATVLLGFALAFGVLYVRHARTHPAPVLDFRLFRIPTFAVACTAGMLFRVSFGALPFLLPLMLQLGFGLSAAASGMITFASAAGSVVMKAVARFVLRRFGYRNTLLWNGMICTTYIAVCAFFRPDWPLAVLYAILLTGGIFRSLQFTAYGTLVYGDIPVAETSAATGFHSMVQQISVTFGVAISAGVLSSIMAFWGHNNPSLLDFTATFLVIAGMSLLAVPICLRLESAAGAELSGHRAVARIAREEAEAELPG